MNRQDFYFDLPQELIAKYPLEKRSDSRMLCLDKHTGERSDRRFTEIVDLLNSNDLLVFNDTKVIPARLYGHKESGGKVEILVERIVGHYDALCLVRASNSPKAGSNLVLQDRSVVQVKSRKGQFFELAFEQSQPLLDRLGAIGQMPLPHYMEREAVGRDDIRYQTVYANQPGAVAAPTAGLHFDRKLMEALIAKGVNQTFVTLHVGSGTFQPVKVDKLSDHVMHAERFSLSAESAELINTTKARGGRVIAVGTTSVRVLESSVAADGTAQAGSGETNIFIYPGKPFHLTNGLITNFHLPESTLIMLVSAFAGTQQTLAAYEHAVQERYRFFSYGDAMFIS